MKHVIVLSHWPHVAQLVSENVAGTVHTGHMLSNKLRRIFDTVSFNQSENGIPNDVIFSAAAIAAVAAVTSLAIPFSDWLNETMSKMRRNLLLNIVSSVNGSSNILGHKLSNKLLNLLLV